MKPKIQVTGATGPVTFFLARGDFEIGIQQSNIMVGAPGTDYVGSLPGAMNKSCPFRVGVVAVSKQQDAARAMIKFMISPEAAPLLRKVHEEPAVNSDDRDKNEQIGKSSCGRCRARSSEHS